MQQNVKSTMFFRSLNNLLHTFEHNFNYFEMLSEFCGTLDKYF